MFHPMTQFFPTNKLIFHWLPKPCLLLATQSAKCELDMSATRNNKKFKDTQQLLAKQTTFGKEKKAILPVLPKRRTRSSTKLSSEALRSTPSTSTDTLSVKDYIDSSSTPNDTSEAGLETESNDHIRLTTPLSPRKHIKTDTDHQPNGFEKEPLATSSIPRVVLVLFTVFYCYSWLIISLFLFVGPNNEMCRSFFGRGRHHLRFIFPRLRIISAYIFLTVVIWSTASHIQILPAPFFEHESQYFRDYGEDNYSLCSVHV